MKVCFKTADGLLSLEEVPAETECLRISRPINIPLIDHAIGSEWPVRIYERTVDRLAGVPVFEEVL